MKYPTLATIAGAMAIALSGCEDTHYAGAASKCGNSGGGLAGLPAPAPVWTHAQADAIYFAPRGADLDGDGRLEIIVTGGNEMPATGEVVALDGATGAVRWRATADTQLYSSPVFLDVTSDGLLIRETKFRKTRLVPLHDTAVAGLKRYLARRRLRSEADPVFVDARGLPLRYIAVKETFDRLVGRTGIVPTARRRPRLHDLRHTFAVRALQSSPAGRSRCGAHMAALATYMGHVNIYATYWYLEATADLMRDVAAAGEGFMSEGSQP